MILHLLVEDSYIDEFAAGLPKDKVTIIEEDFKENQKKLQNTLEDYQNHESGFISYSENMKDINMWLKEKEE